MRIPEASLHRGFGHEAAQAFDPTSFASFQQATASAVRGMMTIDLLHHRAACRDAPM